MGRDTRGVRCGRTFAPGRPRRTGRRSARARYRRSSSAARARAARRAPPATTPPRLRGRASPAIGQLKPRPLRRGCPGRRASRSTAAQSIEEAKRQPVSEAPCASAARARVRGEARTADDGVRAGARREWRRPRGGAAGLASAAAGFRLARRGRRAVGGPPARVGLRAAGAGARRGLASLGARHSLACWGVPAGRTARTSRCAHALPGAHLGAGRLCLACGRGRRRRRRGSAARPGGRRGGRRRRGRRLSGPTRPAGGRRGRLRLGQQQQRGDEGLQACQARRRLRRGLLRQHLHGAARR